VSQPDALKSLMLKYVDDVDAVSAMSAYASSVAGVDSNQRVSYKARAAARVTMVSHMRDIISLWSAREKGVLLMDEVDVLLHSLKSEVQWTPAHVAVLVAVECRCTQEALHCVAKPSSCTTLSSLTLLYCLLR
jgi:hypothetical protein